ncbi:MAG TPA: acylphosphatase [Nocardioides sp.]|nr:acylphosphatase [Nocardioides sp.]
MKRVHVEVSGSVQGVFFRDSCRSEARSRGVAGWVRNTAEGAVEVELEGDDDAVDAMVEWCHTGPPRAEVEAVRTREVPPTGADRFEVH